MKKIKSNISKDDLSENLSFVCVIILIKVRFVLKKSEVVMRQKDKTINHIIISQELNLSFDIKAVKIENKKGVDQKTINILGNMLSTCLLKASTNIFMADLDQTTKAE